MGKKPGKENANTRIAKTASRVGLPFGKPACGVCGRGTRRMRRPKWSVCEAGHRLYKIKGR